MAYFDIEMIYNLEIRSELKRAYDYLMKANGKVIEIIIVGKKRTLRQNRAMYLYFELLSKALKRAGIDMRTLIEDDIDIPFTPETVKSHLWVPVQKAYLEKISTTELETKDIPMIYDILNKHIGERTGLHIPFPNWDYGLNK